MDVAFLIEHNNFLIKRIVIIKKNLIKKNSEIHC